MVVNLIRQRLFSAFAALKFEQQRHIYTLEGKILPSVSKLVEGHCIKTDFESILPYSAAKVSKVEGKTVTPDELRTRWHNKRDLRCNIGHVTHDFMEHYNGSQNPRTAWESAGVKFFKDMSVEYDVVFRELRMFSRRYRYAGTEDLILIHKETGHLIAADYKTNEDLFKNYKGKCLKAPFDTMEESPYNKYQIQLSYYQIFLEEIELTVKDRWLVYLQEDGNYKIYPLYDLTNYLKDQLESKIAA